MAGRAKPIVPRFWSHVDKNGPNGCWLWTGTIVRGYGRFSVGTNKSPVNAHRFSWELAHGPIAPGLMACHKCDNQRCVNPEHIFLGSQTDNMRDYAKKQRQSSLRISDETIVAVEALKGAMSVAAAASRLGVSAATVGRVWRGSHRRGAPNWTSRIPSEWEAPK